MIVLTASTDSLKLTTSGSAGIHYSVAHNTIDIPDVSACTAASSRGQISSATTTTLVSAPSAGNVRQIKGILLTNVHASAANTLTLKVTVSGTDYTLGVFTLEAGETLQYVDGKGFLTEPLAGHTHAGLAPSGGSDGHVLTKQSASDYDYAWEAQTLGVTYGESELDCGIFPGATIKTFTVTSAACTAASKLLAYVTPKATADHSLDEHTVDPPLVFAHSPASGSFSITLRARGNTRLYGDYNIGWSHT